MVPGPLVGPDPTDPSEVNPARTSPALGLAFPLPRDAPRGWGPGVTPGHLCGAAAGRCSETPSCTGSPVSRRPAAQPRSRGCQATHSCEVAESCGLMAIPGAHLTANAPSPLLGHQASKGRGGNS